MPATAKKPAAPKTKPQTTGQVSVVDSQSTGNSTTKKTYVIFLLDRSGSMYSCINETISGFNEQVETIKRDSALGGETFVSLYTFGSDVRRVYDNAGIERIQPLTTETYRPTGSTPYYDAMGMALTDLSAFDDASNPDVGFLVVAVTDGGENSSKEWTADAVKTKVTALEATGRWTFVYIGAGQDLKQMAAATGQNVNNMAAYSATSKGTQVMNSNLRAATSSYFSARSMGETATEAFWGTEAPADFTEAKESPVVSNPSVLIGNNSGSTTGRYSSSKPNYSQPPSSLNHPKSDYDATAGVDVDLTQRVPVPKPTRGDYS